MDSYFSSSNSVCRVIEGSPNSTVKSLPRNRSSTSARNRSSPSALSATPSI
ncbi:hypothetical protein HYC85_023213 [Camellia sinensis]|uniref:Uncharacterized protein n=1 Tax=Camellia sinensis TaxID=4442 RepID=A0A7J7GHQ5_CAMSI|nr:hypothetical protein HYC85_023213 [Camellia sinensis]